MFPPGIATDKTLRQCTPNELQSGSFCPREMMYAPNSAKSFFGFHECFRPEDTSHEFDEVIRPLVCFSSASDLPPRREKYMDRAALMWEIFKCFFQVFLEGEDPIGNKAFWDISDMFQVRHHLPIPEFLFAPFLQLKVQWLPQAAVPGHEQHVEFPLNTNVLAVQETDAVTERKEVLRSCEQGIASFERSLNPSNGRRVRDAPTHTKATVCRSVFRVRIKSSPVPRIRTSAPKRLSTLLTEPSGPPVFHCFTCIAIWACWMFHAPFRAEKGYLFQYGAL